MSFWSSVMYIITKTVESLVILGDQGLWISWVQVTFFMCRNHIYEITFRIDTGQSRKIGPHDFK